MADLRIIDIGTTTTTIAADDYIAIDGVKNGTSTGNVTVDAMYFSVLGVKHG